MSIWRDEIFGPVLSVARASDYDAAVDLVHQHPYGNGVAIFTRDGDAARKFTQDIEVGMVGVNVPIPVPMAFHSFGGWKQSLFGDHHIHGPEGIRFYTRLKTVTTRWPKGVRSGLGIRHANAGIKQRPAPFMAIGAGHGRNLRQRHSQADSRSIHPLGGNPGGRDPR